MQESSQNEVLHHQIQNWKSLIISCFVSLLSVFFIHFTLFLLPLFLPASSFLTLLPLAAVLIILVVGLGSCCKRIAGVRASAPAFVFFSIFFIWAVYIFVVRRVISYLEDIAFNTEMTLLIIGLCWMMLSDPGSVIHNSSHYDLTVEIPASNGEVLKTSPFVGEQESLAEEGHRRVRYCRHCRTYVKGFDHHCPAFGNCVGQKNHLLFIVLLLGFVVSEVSYVACGFQFIAKAQSGNEVGKEASISRNLVFSTQLFSLFQVVWQVIFILWHVHCACFNIKTDEWINWRKYPEFQIKISPRLGETQTTTHFVNPYNKGILSNLKEFRAAKG